MASLPSLQDLQKRSEEVEKELSRLRAAHDTFMREWEDILQRKKHLVEEAHRVVDVEKLKSVTATLSHLHTNS